MTYHGMQCALCDRTLMQGGNDGQRPYWVRIDAPCGRTSWHEAKAIGDDDPAMYEARCRECAGKTMEAGDA